ncbi:hypothetical protein BHE74_00059559 [Ensete ventricosum]|nr:hypothetical protein GW17_00025094 [Ensete ventricosum]RWW35503.1 hypothetical protein BHE74_00059559 [Ensete ventricosum]
MAAHATAAHSRLLLPRVASAPGASSNRRASAIRCVSAAPGEDQKTSGRVATVKNSGDSLMICRVLNGMWQTSGGWGSIDRDDAVEAMLRYADAGLSTFDMADHYGPAEDLYGIFINRVRRERPPEMLEEVRGYGTVMGGLLSEKFLDANVSIPFAGPPLNTPSLQKYKRMVDAWGGWSLFQVLLQTMKKVASKHGVSLPTVAVRYILNQPSVAGSMVGVRLGLSEHIKDTNAIFSLELDDEDMNSITEVSKQGRDLVKVIGDCGDEYRRI